MDQYGTNIGLLQKPTEPRCQANPNNKSQGKTLSNFTYEIIIMQPVGFYLHK